MATKTADLLNDLQSWATGQDRSKAPMQEVQTLLQEAELEAQKNEALQKKSRRLFGASAVAFTLAGVMALLPLDTGPLVPLALVWMIFMAFWTMRVSQYSPIRRLRAKLDKLTERLLGFFSSKKERKGIKLQTQREDSMVMGVGAALAESLGVEAVWIRALLLAVLFFSGGSVIIPYIVAGVLLQYSDKRKKRNNLLLK